MHAIEASDVADKLFDKLRTAAKRALRLDRPHIRPDVLLGLVLMPKYDPEYKALNIRVFGLRRHLSNHPDQQQKISESLRKAAQVTTRKASGQAVVLLQHLARCGAQICPDFDISREGQVVANLLNDPMEKLRRGLVYIWEKHMEHRLKDRNGMDDLRDFDRDLTLKDYLKMNGSDRALMRLITSGASLTANERQHWRTPEDPICIHCGQETRDITKSLDATSL